MDSKVNKISDNENELEVTLTYEEIKPEIDAAYKEERKNLELPGFRKGKVPIEMLKKMYGEAIEYKASEKIATKKFWDIADKLDLKPISTPSLTDINFEQGTKLSFKVKYEIMPVITLKDYKGLEIEKPVWNVKEEDLKKEVDYILKSSATFEDAESVEDEHNKITVLLQKLDDNGEPIVGSVSDNMAIDLTDERVNEDIKKNAIGKKVAESFNFEFTDEHMHGEEKHVVNYKYRADIKKIEKYIYPEMTEEFIKKISKDKATNENELKEEIKSGIQKYYDNQSDNIYTNNLLNAVIKENDFTPPTGYTELMLDRFVEAEKEEAKRQGYPNVDNKILRENLKSKAEWNAKWQIILENIIKIENIKVEEEEIEKLAQEESDKTGISLEKMKKFFKDSNRSATLLEDKVIKFLKDNNKVKEVDPAASKDNKKE